MGLLSLCRFLFLPRGTKGRDEANAPQARPSLHVMVVTHFNGCFDCCPLPYLFRCPKEVNFSTASDDSLNRWPLIVGYWPLHWPLSTFIFDDPKHVGSLLVAAVVSSGRLTKGNNANAPFNDLGRCPVLGQGFDRTILQNKTLFQRWSPLHTWECLMITVLCVNWPV